MVVVHCGAWQLYLQTKKKFIYQFRLVNAMHCNGPLTQVRSSAWTVHSALFKFLFCQNENSMDDETLHLSLAERWTCYEHCQLLKCYLDMLPEPPPALPPPSLPEDAQTDSNEPQPPSQQSQVPASLADRKVFKLDPWFMCLIWEWVKILHSMYLLHVSTMLIDVLVFRLCGQPYMKIITWLMVRL